MKHKKAPLLVLAVVTIVALAAVLLSFNSTDDSDKQEDTKLSTSQSRNLDFPEDLLVGGHNYKLIDSSKPEGTARWATYGLADGPSATLNMLKASNTEGRITFPDKDSLLNDSNAVEAYIKDKLDTAEIENTAVISAEFNKLGEGTEIYELRYSYSVEAINDQKIYWTYVIVYDYAESFVHEFNIFLDAQTDTAFEEIDEAKEALGAVY